MTVICSRVRLSRKFVELMRDVFNYTASKDYDYVIIIDGAEGSGKSTLALHIAMLLNYFKNKRTCVDLDYVYFTVDELKRFYKQLDNELTVHLFDEAHNIISSSNATTKTNKNLTAFLKTARALKQFYIFVTPTFTSIDNDVLRRADMLVHVPRRGRALVFVANEKEQLILDAKFAQRKLSKLVTVEYLINRFQLKPTMLIRFGEVDSDAFSKYYAVKRERLLEFINKVLAEQDESDVDEASDDVENENYITLKQIKKKYNIDDDELFELVSKAEQANAIKRSKRSIKIAESFVAQYVSDV